jgi:S-(hydroxymethyl)glutathione dehydrogenase / alcohol dehydrogenase
MRTFKAAVLVEQKKPLQIMYITGALKLEVGQVLVKVFYSGICGSQLGEIAGVKGEDKYLPHLLGHEGSGEVRAVGPGVTHVRRGDRVVMHWRKGAGIESVPPRYDLAGKKMNAGLVTTFNEYAVVSENRVTKIPNDSDMKVAALFGCAVTTGFGVVENNAKVKIGESVGVFGAGGIGLNIIQAAAMSSAYPIIAVDLHENRLGLAKKMGATHAIRARKYTEQDIEQILGERELDVFIDNTGNPKVIELGYRTVGPQGRVICVGVPDKQDDICIHSLDLHFGKSITGSYGGETAPHEDIPRYMRLFEEKRLELKSLITKTVRLSDINEAISEMRSGEISGRCLIDLTDS